MLSCLAFCLRGKYAYAELVGPRGPVVSERLTLGLVLFGPRCTYPAHSHVGMRTVRRSS